MNSKLLSNTKTINPPIPPLTLRRSGSKWTIGPRRPPHQTHKGKGKGKGKSKKRTGKGKKGNRNSNSNRNTRKAHVVNSIMGRTKNQRRRRLTHRTLLRQTSNILTTKNIDLGDSYDGDVNEYLNDIKAEYNDDAILDYTFYHITETKNIPSITKHGLLINKRGTGYNQNIKLGKTQPSIFFSLSLPFILNEAVNADVNTSINEILERYSNYTLGDKVFLLLSDKQLTILQITIPKKLIDKHITEIGLTNDIEIKLTVNIQPKYIKIVTTIDEKPVSNLLDFVNANFILLNRTLL